MTLAQRIAQQAAREAHEAPWHLHTWQYAAFRTQETCNVCPATRHTAPVWVQRARSNTLPAKDMTEG